MRILHLYRPTLPGQRAQSIQVVHTCHALAARGHEVTLLADSASRDATPGRALDVLGLTPVPGLHIHCAPARQRALAGLWFRHQLARWWAGPGGVVLARDKRRLHAALEAHGPRHRIVLETHELDSALVADAGRPSGPIHTLEAALASRAHALVANCAGTLEAWREAHGPSLPPLQRVIHNATAPSRLRSHRPGPDPVVRCVGSLRAFKGLASLLEAAPRLPVPLHIVGGTPQELSTPVPPGVEVSPAVPFPAVPDLLARSAVLLLPLADNRFGRQLTNPLKLWDYLATAQPIVVPDLPTVSEVAASTGTTLHRYRPGDPDSLVAAVQAALHAPPRTPVVRTWAERAAELEACF